MAMIALLSLLGFERRSHALNVIHGVVHVRGWMDASDQPSSGVATRPSYSLQVNIGGTGKVRDIRLGAATTPSSSLIFSAMSASSSIEESPVREKAHHITKTSSTVTPAERDGRRPFRIGSLKTYLVRHSIERRRPQGEHHESSYRICGPRAGVPGHHRSLYPSSSRRLGPARLWSSPWRSPSRLLGLEAQTLPAAPWPLAAARTSALRRLSDAALPASALLSCSMKTGSGQH